VKRYEGLYPREKIFKIPQAFEAQVLLRNGTQDLPRMTKILQNERVCFQRLSFFFCEICW